VIDSRRHSKSYLDSAAHYERRYSYALMDEYRGLAVAIRSDLETEIWHLPIFTVSLSEAGFEKVYQGTTLLNVYRVDLKDKPFVVHLTLYAGALGNMQDHDRTLSALNANDILPANKQP